MTDLLVHRDGPVLEIVFARPHKKNALTVAMYAAAADALLQAEADDDVRVVLFRGEGGVFTSGNDLTDFLANPPTGDDAPVFRFISALATATRPLVMAVEGPAIGLGTTMLLHADLVVAAEGTRFQMPFTQLGLVPEAASSLLVPRLLGPVRAAQLLQLCETFGPDQALAWGLVNAVAPAPEHLAKARAWAATLAARPAAALRATKALCRRADQAEILAQMKVEADVFVQRLQSDEFRQAVAAFLGRGR